MLCEKGGLSATAQSIDKKKLPEFLIYNITIQWMFYKKKERFARISHVQHYNSVVIVQKYSTEFLIYDRDQRAKSKFCRD